MKFLFRLLLIIAFAVAIGIFARSNDGYVQVAAPLFRFESSLNFFIIAWVISLLIFYYLIRMIRNIKQLPQWWRTYREHKTSEKIFKLQSELFFELQRERYDDARKKTKKLLAFPEMYPLTAVIGAETALRTKDIETAESLIHSDALSATMCEVTRALLEAELLLVKNEPERALKLLREMREQSGLHSAALKIELRALIAARRYQEILPMIERLEYIHGVSADEAQFMREAVKAYLDDKEAKERAPKENDTSENHDALND
ncbi:MAG: hypothetical protein LBS40_02325 [Burkholderiales bacterium]|jgi:uncharacterized protein HemY|nr:hypothetical protein [Burkholderiales bacterium]